jgi:hypothetical protein
MKRLWLLFSQSVTVLLAAYFVVGVMKPEWLNKRPTLSGAVSVIEAPSGRIGHCGRRQLQPCGQARVTRRGQHQHQQGGRKAPAQW